MTDGMDDYQEKVRAWEKAKKREKAEKLKEVLSARGGMYPPYLKN